MHFFNFNNNSEINSNEEKSKWYYEDNEEKLQKIILDWYKELSDEDKK